MRVFILDDDEISNELTSIILNLSGIEHIDVRHSGREAVRFLDEHQEKNTFPDLIFVDLNLPGMNGFEFIEFYEKTYLNMNPETKIIMLTNSVNEDEKFKALTYESVIDFWSKPLNINPLEEVLSRISVRS
ncbi:MAG TPA: response regulator [Bacteroidales bacterium]|nr:response regulator [Bacteroidales bacterium]